MKRPQGFDDSTASTSESRSGAGRDRSVGRQKRKPEARTDGSRRETPERVPSARQAARALRRAERDRKRFERGEVRRFTRRTRHRRTLWLTLAAFVATLAVVLAVAVFSPILALRTIVVDGNSSVTSDQITTAVDDQLGTPLALVDFDRITANLSGYPLIRSYVTETVPPDTLIIHVVERKPVGQIVSGSVFRVVDPAGVQLDTAARRADGVPVIDIHGADVDSPAFASVVEVLLALPQKLRVKVDTISAKTKDDVTLSLAGLRQTVVWGSADRSKYKARVFAAMLPLYSKSGAGQYIVSAPDSAVFRRR